MHAHGAYCSGRLGARQRNRARRWRLPLLAFLGAGAASLGAQEPAKPEIRIGATILLTGFRNTSTVNNTDVPTLVLPAAADSGFGAAAGGSVRQTRARLTGTWSGFAGGTLDGELDVDFFGGQQPSGGGRTHPVLRLRRAFAEIRWHSGSLLVGQEAPPVFELNPVSLLSSGFPVFASSGNLWLWLPQIRGTWHVNPDAAVRLRVQGAIVAPSAGEPQDPFLTRPDRAERSGRPGLEGRVLLRWGDGERRGELGAGGHLGWLEVAPSRRVTSRAIGVELRWPIGRWLELAGEYMDGRGLAGLGGGGVGQNLTADSLAVRTRGGWAQLVARPSPRWELGAGAGLDDPRDEDVGTTGRQANRNLTAHVSWTATPLRAGVQYQLLSTRYAAGARRNHQLALGLALDL